MSFLGKKGKMDIFGTRKLGDSKKNERLLKIQKIHKIEKQKFAKEQDLS